MENAKELLTEVEAPVGDLKAGGRGLLYLGFMDNPAKIPDTDYHRRQAVDVATRGYIELLDENEFKLTLSGVVNFVDRYQRQVQAGIIDERTTINYFRCSHADRTRDGYDGTPIVASNEGTLKYINLLMATQHLSISDKSSAYDYIVLDFIDEYTGKSHDLFPGDTVVMTEEGYTVHKFSE